MADEYRYSTRELVTQVSPKDSFKRRRIESTISAPSKVVGGLDAENVIAAAPHAELLIRRKISFDENSTNIAVADVLQSVLEAEDLAYALYDRRHSYGQSSDQGAIRVRTFRDDGVEYDDIEYMVKKVETPEGLNAFILEPINVPVGATPEIKVLFAGTKDMPGVIRDLEKKAAGHESFECHKYNLMKDLNDAVGRIQGKEVKISLVGHSLGGADAQRMAIEITEAVARPSDTGVLEQIHFGKQDCPAFKSKNITLNLVTSAAPMVTEKQAKKFADDLSIATTCRNNGNQPMIFTATAHINNRDIVPTFGQQHLLSAQSSKGKSVLSMCQRARVVFAKSTLLNHAINFYHDPNSPKLGKIEILQVSKSDRGDDETKKKTENKMRQVMDRASGIDQGTFSQLLKSLISGLAIRLGWGADLYSKSDELKPISQSLRSPAAC